MSFHKRGGLSQWIREAYGHKKGQEHPWIVWRPEKNWIKTIVFSISTFIKMLHSYIEAFTCSWYISKTYHSPVNVHVTATHCIHSTPVYWSGLGRNCYGTDTYLPSSYSRSESLFRTRSVATNLVLWLEFQTMRCVILDKHGAVTWPPISFLSVALRRQKDVCFPPESAYFLCKYYDQSTFTYFVPWLGV